jgi:hypothetical protein
MGLMSPVNYAQRYWGLDVPLSDGPFRVNVHQYRLRTPDAEKDALFGALKEHFRTNQKSNPGWKLPLTVNGQPADFSGTGEMIHRVVNPFFGKGSPEDCQIVLQLAVLLRKRTKADLQRYCDDYLGLDCNGFVGNFLFRVRGGSSWRADPGAGGAGPSDTITQIMDHAGGVKVRTEEDLVPNRSYVLGEVDASYRIIPGGLTADEGHIVITEPGRRMGSGSEGTYEPTMNLDGKDAGAIGKLAFWGVESTGQLGLVQSWYAIAQLRVGNKDIDGVFRCFRGCKREFRNFRIIALA